jgi:hypothetical protein
MGDEGGPRTSHHRRRSRCIKNLIEERLFERRRDLLSDLCVVFMDTTTLHFEGQGGQTLGQRGHSNDYRPHQKQMVVTHHGPGRSTGMFGDLAGRHRRRHHAHPGDRPLRQRFAI